MKNPTILQAVGLVMLIGPVVLMALWTGYMCSRDSYGRKDLFYVMGGLAWIAISLVLLSGKGI